MKEIKVVHLEDIPTDYTGVAEYTNGTKHWYLNEELHREDGPAIEETNGTKQWYVNGKLHRTGGPALEYVDGAKYWYVNGNLHRVDGPAREFSTGSKEWWIDGKRHRLDGPACEYINGRKQWWIHGNFYGDQPFILKNLIVLDEYKGKYNLTWYKVMDSYGTIRRTLPDIPGLLIK